MHSGFQEYTPGTIPSGAVHFPAHSLLNGYPSFVVRLLRETGQGQLARIVINDKPDFVTLGWIKKKRISCIELSNELCAPLQP
jgi:hypothetical protein